MTKKGNKKPLLSGTLVGTDSKGLCSAEADQHRDRITRFGSLKHRARLQENYLWTLANYDNPTQESQQAIKSASKLKECGNFLFFKNYYTIDQVKLTKFNACSQHLLCPFCAGIRASKSMQRYSERINQVLNENKKLKPVLITFTVKNGENLEERFHHLMTSFRMLLDRRRDALKKGRGYNEFCKVNGAMYSYENTYNEKTNEWHPHLHMFALLDDWVDQEKLSDTWYDITGDSMIVDIRRVKKSKGKGLSEAIAEVCKYALKFGDMTVQKTWDAYRVLKGKRLTGSLGCLWGVKIPDSMLDEPINDDLPYLEMLYKFVYGKKSYYDLVMTRQIEPQAKTRLSEEEELRTNDRSDRSLQPKAQVCTAGGRGCATSHTTPSVVHTYRSKKQHWQVSPAVRCRTYTRIRQWDGFLYHFDLSEYLINWLEKKLEPC